MGAKRRERTFEIGRDKQDGGWYRVGPRLGLVNGWWLGSVAYFCPEDFERVTGLRLRPGEKVTFKLVRVP